MVTTILIHLFFLFPKKDQKNKIEIKKYKKKKK